LLEFLRIRANREASQAEQAFSPADAKPDVERHHPRGLDEEGVEFRADHRVDVGEQLRQAHQCLGHGRLQRGALALGRFRGEAAARDQVLGQARSG